MRLDPLRFSDEIVRVYESCVDELLVNLARHFNVSAMGNIPTFEFEVELLAKMGAIRKETAAIIARHVADNEPMIEEAVKTAMLDALRDVEPELAQAARAGLLEGTDMEMLDGIQDQLLSYSRQAVKQTNLVNTVMLDGTMEAYRKGIYAATDIVRQMKEAQTVLNAETGKVITGTSTLQEAVRSGVRAMHEAGITGFVDHGGHHWSAEAYVRMDVKTTCSNAANQAVMTRNEQYGNDLIWVNTNATARPGCYPWQGKVISMANRARVVTDGDGRRVQAYAVSQTTYGQPDGIYGINCHHGPMNVFIPGMSSVRGLEAAPSKDESDQIYQLTQKQRRMEREVRYAKREAAMLDAAGDKEGFEKAALMVKEKQAKLKAFVNEHGESLVLRSDRTQVLGYNRSVSGKASAISRKYSGYHYRKDGTVVVTHDWKQKGHASVPKKNKPFAVVDTKSSKGGMEQIDRSFYDARGVLVRQVHSGPHARLDKHPYGKNGEHAHDYEWKDGKTIKTTRDLTESERKESADILED